MKNKKVLFLSFVLIFLFNIAGIEASQTIIIDPVAGSCTDLSPANTGNGTCAITAVSAFAVSETITFIASTIGPEASFVVTGSVSGDLGVVVSDTPTVIYNSNTIALFTITIADGVTPYAIADSFSVVTTPGTELKKSTFDLFDLTQVCLNGCDAGGPITATNLSGSSTGTNTGDVTLGAIGSSANANGASLSSQVLTLQPASASFGGVLSSGVQSIAGAKTFTGAISASNLSGSNTGDQTITLTSDVTGSGIGSFATTLATVNSNVGSFGSSTAIPSFTVNGKGLITAASTNVVIAPADTLTGTILATNVVTSSLTSVGTIGTGVWQGTAIADTYIGTPYIKADGTRALTGNWAAGAFSGTFNSVAVGSAANTINGLATIINSGTLTLPTSTDTLVGKATSDVLTNKTLSGNTATNLISGSGTLTLNTTGTVTLPNATDTLVGKATTDQFSNKTFAQNLLPEANNTRDLGVTGTRWANLWLGGNATVTGNVAATGTVTGSNLSGTSTGTNTGDQTITLTGDVTGTGTGSFVTAIGSGVIVNADVNASAAIDGTKISPNFGSQNILTTGTATSASFIPTSSTVPANGLYLSAANAVSLATNSTKVATIGATGATVIGSASVNTTQYLTIGNASSSANVAISGVDQTALATDFTASSSATTTATGVAAFVRTVNASFTTAVAANFRADTISKGASNVITRSIQYQLSGALTVGGSNAGISDNILFSGDYFINSTSTAPSLLSGALTVNSVNLTSSTVPANGIYLSAANTLAFAANTTLYGSISSAGLWTRGASGGTTTHVDNGALGVTRNFSVGTATPSTLAMNYVGGNILTTTNQVAYYGQFTTNSSATASTRGIYIDLATAASSYTTAFASAFMGGITAGSGSVITRAIMFDASNGFTATGTITNKAYISDSQSFSGSYFIFSSNVLPSNINGPVVIGSSNGFTGTTYLIRATTSGTSPLTGVSQYGIQTDPVFTSASTTDVADYFAKVQTTNSSYTTTVAAGFSSLLAVKGASNTITRLINYLAVPQTAGSTGNATLADNVLFSGSYFINSTDTSPSLISGAVQLGATNSSVAHVFNGGSFTFNTADQAGVLTLNDSGTSSSLLFTNASQAGNAKFLIRSAAGGTGNAYIAYDTNDDIYSAGILNSDDSWVICNASDLTSGCKVKLLNNNFSNLLGDFVIASAGGGLTIKEGSNAKMGTCTLVLGTCTVSTTKVTASSRIFLTPQSLGTVAVATPVAVTARTGATSFVITSASATDTSVIAWVIFEPS